MRIIPSASLRQEVRGGDQIVTKLGYGVYSLLVEIMSRDKDVLWQQ